MNGPVFIGSDDIEVGAGYHYLPPSTARLDLPAQWQRTNTRDTP